MCVCGGGVRDRDRERERDRGRDRGRKNAESKVSRRQCGEIHLKMAEMLLRAGVMAPKVERAIARATR